MDLRSTCHGQTLARRFGGETWAIEAKLTSSPSPEDLERLNKTADLIKARWRILVSRTRQDVSSGRQASVSLRAFLDMLAKA